jgi:hypothetical protein
MRAPSGQTTRQIAATVVALRRAIASQWTWHATKGATNNIVELRWRGIVLGSVKLIDAGRLWYGFAGDQRSNSMPSPASARQWVETHVIEMLIAALEIKPSDDYRTRSARPPRTAARHLYPTGGTLG